MKKMIWPVRYAMGVLTSTYRLYLFLGLLAVLALRSQAQPSSRAEFVRLLEICRDKPYPTQITTISQLITWWNSGRLTKDSTYADMVLELAKARFKTDDVPGAIATLKQVIRLYSTKLPALRPIDNVKAHYRLGYYYKERNEYTKATTVLRRAVSLGEKLADNSWTAFAYTTLAYISYSTGEYQKAEKLAQQGIEQATGANNDIAYLESSSEYVKALLALNRNTEAETALSKVITIARKNPEARYELAISLVRRAKLVENTAPNEALRLYKEALSINTEDKVDRLIVDNHIDLGYFYYNQHQYEPALHHYQAALRQATDLFVKLRILNNIGVLYWRQGRYDVALISYQRALQAIDKDFAGKKFEELPQAELIRLASQKEFLLTLMQDKADTWLDYAKATGSRQRLQHALATYRVADQMIDFMRWEHTGQQSKLFWRQKTRGMYERAIETCYRLGDVEQAFRFMEKSRAVMLADQLNELGARQQLAPAQVTQEQQLRQAVTDQQATLTMLTPDSSAYASARSELLNQQDRLDAFLKQLEASNPAYYRYKYDNTTPSLADLKAYLKPRQAQFVSYFAGDSALYVLAVAAGRDTLIRQPLGTYKQTVRQFMDLLANPDAMNQTANVRQFLQLGNGLYRQLLAPLGLRGGRVIVSPDGAFVPVEALSRSATKPDYLVMIHAFSYAYSAGLLLKTQPSEPAGWRQTDFLGVAPVSYAPALGQVSLPGSDGAIQDIARRFGSAVLLTRAQATRRAFLTEAAHARVVHLFTHGTATDSIDTEPRLYFADSTLNLSELGTDGLPITQLVVLAACKTGVGSYQRGEGVFSMARGFAALGVPSVLTTLWSVDNKATYTITDLFEQYLTRGLSKDEALQQAQREWLTTTDGVRQLPTYWAGLILVGNTEPLSQPTPWLWLAAGLGGLVVGSAWLWRRKRRTTSVTSSLRPA